MTIFINYRRADSKQIVDRLDEHLRKEFGDQDVFRDVASILAGTDFTAALNKALATCDVAIAVVGSHWVSPRLEQPGDFVRCELEALLARKIPIIPLLLDGAELPSPEQIPDSLGALLSRQAVEFDSIKHFKPDVQRLIASIRAVRKPGIPFRQLFFGAGVVAILFGAWLMSPATRRASSLGVGGTDEAGAFLREASVSGAHVGGASTDNSDSGPAEVAGHGGAATTHAAVGQGAKRAGLRCDVCKTSNHPSIFAYTYGVGRPAPPAWCDFRCTTCKQYDCK